MVKAGTAKLVGRTWEIRAVPHVMMRLRRLFQGTERQGDVLRVNDTLEGARDLEWVCSRWDIEVEPLEQLRKNASRHREAEDSIKRMFEASYTPRTFSLAVEPREYQRAAAELALTMRSLLVADDLGLGKTMSAICALTDPSARPALVVTTTSLPRQWERMIKLYAPEMRVHRIRDGALYDVASWGRRGKVIPAQVTLFGPTHGGARLPDVIVTSYSKLAKWGEYLAQVVKSVTFDECQELRSRGTDRWNAAKEIADHVDMRIGLSATPIHNYGGEVWNVMSIIAPEKLGTLHEFRATWCTPGEDARKMMLTDPGAFGAWAREQGIMLRRTRRDVGRELAQHTKIQHEIDVEQAPLTAIEGRAIELARIIIAHGLSGKEKMDASQELSWRLRQATGIGKAPHAADFVRLLVENGERVLVGAWHREVHSIIAERLKDLGVVMYTGEESVAAKERARAAFIAGEAKVLLISLRSGAGLDGLQHACRTVVHAELDWSPAIHGQLDGRVHRDGQPDPVVSYYLTTNSGSDPIVADVLGVKAMQIEPIINPAGGQVITQIDPEHIQKLARGYLERVGGALPDGVRSLAVKRSEGRPTP